MRFLIAPFLLLLATACANEQSSADANAGREDAAERDADPLDAKAEDAGALDADPMDAAAMDADPVDAEVMDAEPIDADPIDAGPEPGCGDGVVDAQETCDPGVTACCNSTCDGVRGSGETCRTAAGECDIAETCDGVSLDCPADELAADGAACSSCPEGAACSGCYGGACLDSRTFCSDLLARGQAIGDGIYEVRPAATASITAGTSTVSVFCDMTTDGGGWTMVFKKSRVVPGGGDLLWNGGALNSGDLALLDRSLDTADYSNGFQIDYWSAFTEARVEVVTGTVVEKFIQFDLSGSTPTSWFAPERHTSSSWTDLPTSPTFDNGGNQAFRIGSGRTFYINRVWSGCPNDRGWLMISTIDVCFWETQSGDPADIIYSRLTTESHIPTTAQTGRADTLVILLR